MLSLRSFSIGGAVIVLGVLFYGGFVSGLSVFQIVQGGTGTSTAPTYGKLFVGNSAGTWDYVSTSSLGITGTSDGTFSTTSANYWSTFGLAFSTTSSDYWETQQAARGADGTFSTTSANYWSTLGLGFSTTSADAWGTSKGYITGIAWGAITGTLSNQSDLSAALYGKLGTSSAIAAGANILYATGPNTVASVATGTISATSPVTVTANRSTIGGAATFAIDFTVANSWTGKQTFSNASSTYFSCITFCGIPTGAALTPTAAGEIAHDTTDNQLKLGTGSATAVFDQRRFITFSYATTTAWAGTTTLPAIPLPIGFTFDSVQCKTNVGTLNTQFQYGAAASATVLPAMFSASTTMNTFAWSANNTPGAGATTTVAWGTPASSPTQVSCTITARPTGT